MRIARRFNGITFIKYAQGQKIGKPNNSNVQDQENQRKDKQ